jgi:hypothetical protein
VVGGPLVAHPQRQLVEPVEQQRYPPGAQHVAERRQVDPWPPTPERPAATYCPDRTCGRRRSSTGRVRCRALSCAAILR